MGVVFPWAGASEGKQPDALHHPGNTRTQLTTLQAVRRWKAFIKSTYYIRIIYFYPSRPQRDCVNNAESERAAALRASAKILYIHYNIGIRIIYIVYRVALALYTTTL